MSAFTGSLDHFVLVYSANCYIGDGDLCSVDHRLYSALSGSLKYLLMSWIFLWRVPACRKILCIENLLNVWVSLLCVASSDNGCSESFGSLNWSVTSLSCALKRLSVSYPIDTVLLMHFSPSLSTPCSTYALGNAEGSQHQFCGRAARHSRSPKSFSDVWISRSTYLLWGKCWDFPQLSQFAL